MKIVRLDGRPIDAAWERAEAWLRGRFRAEYQGVRAMALPRDAIVVGVGGERSGGCGRTPLAIGIVRALAERGVSVALVGHGYGARDLGSARLVRDRDDVRSVGDEALIAARDLRDLAPVFVARHRQDAVDAAASLRRIVVVDRLLQTRPTRLALSILAIADRHVSSADSAAFRAGVADVVVHVGGASCAEQVSLHTLDASPVPVPIEVARRVRVGLVTSLARPERVRASLGRLGVDACVHVERGDHAREGADFRARLNAIGAANSVGRWIFDAKSSASIGAPAEGAWRLDHAVTPPPTLIDRLAALAATSRVADLPARFARP